MKKPRIVRRPAAIEDLVAQGEYYVAQGAPDTAVRFLEAVDTAFEQLARRPRVSINLQTRLRQAQPERCWLQFHSLFPLALRVGSALVHRSVGPMNPLLTKEGEGGRSNRRNLANLPWPLLR